MALSLRWKEVKSSRNTLAFTILIVLSAIVCFTLELIIVYSHLRIYKIAADGSYKGVDFSSLSDHPINELRRLKNENIFVILFTLFQLALGIDSVFGHIIIQCLAYTCNHVVMIAFSVIQLWGSIKQRSRLDSFNPFDSRIAFITEIVLISILVVLGLFLAYYFYEIYKEFGWNTYRKIGPSVMYKDMYESIQLFYLNLKLNTFFHMTLCIFYIVVMTQEKYYVYDESPRKMVAYVIHIVLTALLVPMLYFVVKGVINENKPIMISFILVQCILIVDFSLMIDDSGLVWIFWMLTVCVSILLSVTTILLAVMITRNFNKGLKEHLKTITSDEDLKAHENSLGKSIDDDIESLLSNEHPEKP
ncbi:hypothetical protein BDB01DRAFT_847547 [Pilobolus umbonatus]|nr:hypothetical protein BDB01DRAFT_847547 [Pilobolus umbonatus]